MANTIAFDAARYDQLIKFVNDSRDQLEKTLLTPRGGLMLDGTLPTFLKVGSTGWPPVQAIHAGAQRFGDSVHTHLADLTTGWTEFSEQLTTAKAIFKKSNDLATVSASEFISQYPGLGGGAPPVVR